MGQNGKVRNEVLMAGIGGMGVLVSGQVLLEAASQRYEYVSYVSSYGFARRGGLCECTVIISDEKIASPLLDQAEVVMLLDSSQFPSFEHRVRPQGFIIADTAGLTAERRREYYKLYALPFLETATNMGSILGKNLIMLGAYIAITSAISPELIEHELQKRYQDNDKVLTRNLAAFMRGVELVKSTA
jgi:2-oxoglutarate ferredoxin oxidoreductase subunit gamma